MEERKKEIIAFAVAAGEQFKRSIFFLYEKSSDDSDNNIIEEANFMEVSLRFKNRNCREVKEQPYFTEIIPRFSNEISRQGRPMIPVRNQLLSVIWLLATPDSFRSVADRFNRAKSALHDSFIRIVKALNDIADEVILWPKRERLVAVKCGFNKIGILPDVIGAIDGTHIPILAPHVNFESYRTRKCTYVITLQAVCTTELVFTDCFVGNAGSVNDCRIFRNSDLWKCVMENYSEFFLNNEYIIGDKAYPVLTWCITPYINRGNLTDVKIKFNNELSKMRQVVERAFALLKGRFRRLKYLHMSIEYLIPHVILACCVLHNLCIEGSSDVSDVTNYLIDEQNYNITMHSGNLNDSEDDIPVIDTVGSAKRDYLAALIA
ncbi:uncharacterized protein [Prorops nasuta]|uniref:uncharacterized protein n=1 Tax=Prorops nasuta TaxID=863751 RepID=UPI0034CD48C4